MSADPSKVRNIAWHRLMTENRLTEAATTYLLTSESKEEFLRVASSVFDNTLRSLHSKDAMVAIELAAKSEKEATEAFALASSVEAAVGEDKEKSE